MIKFTDRAHILLDDVKTISGGYKVIRSRIARTGVQKYLGREVGGGEHGFGDDDFVSVYRPSDEVFSDNAVNGWAGVPVTKDHPPELVGPDNVNRYQVGDVRDKAHVDLKEGWLGLEYIIRDADAIAAFDSGEYSEVSGGYLAKLDWTPGVTPDGQHYDARQVGIEPNHLALVRRGRAFSDGADNWGAKPLNLNDRKESEVDLVKIMVGDKAVQVAAVDADKVTKMVADHSEAIAVKDKEIGELTVKLADADAKLAEAEKKVLSDEDFAKLIDAKVKANTERAAVKSVLGDKADAMTDAQIEGAYLALGDVGKVDDSARDAIKDKKPVEDSAKLIADAIAKRFNKGA